MSTIPLRIDTKLVNDARTAGLLFDRSPTAQIEFWAKLGRAVEAVLTVDGTGRLRPVGRVEDLDATLALAQTDRGQAKARAVIVRRQGPVYRADATTKHDRDS